MKCRLIAVRFCSRVYHYGFLEAINRTNTRSHVAFNYIKEVEEGTGVRLFLRDKAYDRERQAYLPTGERAVAILTLATAIERTANDIEAVATPLATLDQPRRYSHLMLDDVLLLNDESKPKGQHYRERTRDWLLFPPFVGVVYSREYGAIKSLVADLCGHIQSLYDLVEVLRIRSANGPKAI